MEKAISFLAQVLQRSFSKKEGISRKNENISEPEKKRHHVALVSMPFGVIDSPSIALGLLKPIAQQAGYSVSVHYLNQLFAQIIGPGLYQLISSGPIPTQYLLGEWAFTTALDPAGAGNARDYLHEVLLQEFDTGDDDSTDYAAPSRSMLSQLHKLRAAASAFVDVCAQQVLAVEPEVIGITSMFQQNVASLALAKRIKEIAPHIFIVMGGANCKGEMGSAIREAFPFVDAVVSGEGESAFSELLLRRLTIESEVEPTAPPSAMQSPLPLDNLPFPDYSDYFDTGLADATGLAQFILFETARGCWWGQKHHCIFCGLNSDAMAFRSKSPSRAMQEIEWLIARHGHRKVLVTDNILDMKYFNTFLPMLAEARLNVELFYETKANITLKQVYKLKEAGVTDIQPGIESISDQVLRLIGKGNSAIHNIRLLKNCHQAGIHPAWNIIWGFPGEDAAEYSRMSELVPLLVHLPPPMWAGGVRIDRFSPLHRDARNFGISDLRPARAYNHVYRLPERQLAAIASYFESDTCTAFARRTEITQFAQKIDYWRRMHTGAELVSMKKGSRLIFLDSRPNITHKISVINGRLARLYDLCGQGTTLARVARHFPDTAESLLGADLELLVERKLVILIDNTYLALALPLESYRPSTSKQRTLASLVAEIGVQGDHDDFVIELDRFELRLSEDVPQTARNDH